jgi:hypothetical protein
MTITTHHHNSLDEMVDAVRQTVTEDLQVVVGPALWQPSDGKRAKTWYFIIATGGDGFCCHRVAITGDNFRQRFLFALIQRKPLVIHDVDDELHMARLCAMLWPSPRTRELRKAVEAEKGVQA